MLLLLQLIFVCQFFSSMLTVVALSIYNRVFPSCHSSVLSYYTGVLYLALSSDFAEIYATWFIECIFVGKNYVYRNDMYVTVLCKWKQWDSNKILSLKGLQENESLSLVLFFFILFIIRKLQCQCPFHLEVGVLIHLILTVFSQNA